MPPRDASRFQGQRERERERARTRSRTQERPSEKPRSRLGTTLRTLLTFLLATYPLSCGSTFEWKEVSGKIELFATPLPPVAGEPLALGVLAANVGPIDVWQGTVRIASFVNVDVQKRVDLQVTAANAEIPHAVATAFDRQVLDVAAVPFTTQPVVKDAGAAPTWKGDESCPGVETLSTNACAPASDAGAVPVRVYNARSTAISVYELLPDPLDASRCNIGLLAIVGPKTFRGFSRPAGTVIRVQEDTTASVVRIARIPAVAACDLRME